MAKRKILIVDDETAASGLEEQLTRLGYEVAGIASRRIEVIALSPISVSTVTRISYP